MFAVRYSPETHRMATLVILEGPNQGAHFPIVEPVISVGRDDTCSLQILDDRVSRMHLQLRIETTTGRHIAADYRSAHGVFINDKRIVIDTALNDGDRIKIGQTTLIYLALDHADAPAAFAAAKKKDEWKRTTMLGQ
jgi:pSer/pThr/pTyr-binding forkhead associated (FHA) protein